MTKRLLVVVLGLGALAAAAYHTGIVTPYLASFAAKRQEKAAEVAAKAEMAAPAPVVSVVPAALTNFVETVLVTGSFVAREEIMVAPEVDGLRVLEVKAEQGDRVHKGDILAVLVTEQIEAQIAAKEAALASAVATIERAKSQIAESEARVEEANAQLERARPLVKNKYLSESVFDERQATARAAEAQLASAKGNLSQTEAAKGEVEAQLRELAWRRGNSDVRAPDNGVVSRRTARIGAIAVNAMANGEAMFRIIKDGEIELDAEVAETHLWKVKDGQPANITSSGGVEVTGKVRLVSPEVDKATRLGHVRIFLGDRPELKIGSFGRGTIETARNRAIGVPLSAVLHSDEGATVQVVVDGKVATRQVKTGLETGSTIEIASGLNEGDLVVAKAGTFLREGDAVRPLLPDAKLSEAAR